MASLRNCIGKKENPSNHIMVNKIIYQKNIFANSFKKIRSQIETQKHSIYVINKFLKKKKHQKSL